MTDLVTENFISKIKIKTEEKNLYKNFAYIFTDPTKVIAELMQNARRAGSPAVYFRMNPDIPCLTVNDAGRGIDDLQLLIHNGKSDWNESTIENESPFGMGFLSCLYAADSIRVSSNRKQCLLDSKTLIEGGEVEVMPCSLVKGCEIHLNNFKLSFDETKEAIIKYAKGFAIPVFFNDREVDRPHAIDQLGEWQDTEIGQMHITDKSIHGTNFYVQGLPVKNPFSNYVGQNVIHLDNLFELRMPDRHTFYDESKAKLLIEEHFKKAWIQKIHNAKQNLDPIEFVNLYEEIKFFNLLHILNDVPVLPDLVVYQFCNQPIQSVDMFDEIYRGDLHLGITKSNFENPNFNLMVNMDLDAEGHNGLSMLLQTLCYQQQWLFVKNNALDEGHWIFKTRAIDCNAVNIEIKSDVLLSNVFYSNYVDALVHFVNDFLIRLEGIDYVINNPSIGIPQDNAHIMYIEKNSCVSSALRQISKYQDGNDCFDEDEFEDDCENLTNLRARLLGENPRVTVLKVVKQSGLERAENCKSTATVVVFNEQSYVQCESLESIIHQFAQQYFSCDDRSKVQEFVNTLFKANQETEVN